MLAVGLVLNTVGIRLCCWLIFTLAVYAAVFIALSAGMMAFHGGDGLLSASLAGIAAGAVALAIGQTVFAIAGLRSCGQQLPPRSSFRRRLPAITSFSSCRGSEYPRWLGVR